MESPAYSYAEGWARITVPDSEQTERLADDRCHSLSFLFLPVAIRHCMLMPLLCFIRHSIAAAAHLAPSHRQLRFSSVSFIPSRLSAGRMLNEIWKAEAECICAAQRSTRTARVSRQIISVTF